jgi:hypothetical protein
MQVVFGLFQILRHYAHANANADIVHPFRIVASTHYLQDDKGGGGQGILGSWGH